MIEVRNLVKRYGNTLAVDHVSFTIEEGHIYGFLGPNGAGKSTTMNIMTGYIGATEGDVIINGVDILDEPEKAKMNIGYLPEQPPLYMDMTPEEYLNFAASLKKIPAAERAQAVEDAIERTHISDVRTKLIANLSKGYRQRVGLAQAILGMPSMIILDEPTVGLDPHQIIEIRDLIRELSQQHTVILSSHILSEIQEVCDKIIIINRGKLVANGTPEELEEQLGSTTVEITFKTEDTKKAAAVLSKVKGITRMAKSKSSKPGEMDFKLAVERGLDIREALFNAAVSENVAILMLKTSEASLESIFLEITQKAAMGITEDTSAEENGEPAAESENSSKEAEE